jgi:diacylglycerol kinase family enzyme
MVAAKVEGSGRHGVPRRTSAIFALASLVAMIVVLVAALIQHLLLLIGAILGLFVVISAAVYSLTRTGTRRVLGAILAALALVWSVVLLIRDGDWVVLLILIVLLAVFGVTGRYALGRDLDSVKAGRTPGILVGSAARPVLILNPKSGGGKVDRFRLVEEARQRGVEPIVLQPGDDLVRLAESALTGGADVIGMAGGDGSQALVAGVAMRHRAAFVCVPAGTRNHLALDLGIDPHDVVGALEAFGEAAERTIDLGFVGDRVFVNNVTLGLYAKIVQSPEYRDNKVGTALDMLPQMLGPGAAPFDLRFTGPDGAEHASAQLIMVSNGPYELSGRKGSGSRPRMDVGALGILALRLDSSADVARFLEVPARFRRRYVHGWMQWTGDTFHVDSGGPVEVGIDGEALVLDPPLEFRIVPRALRVRIPLRAPGYSPAALGPPVGALPVLSALLKAAAGRTVPIES